jgi:hypothetical protein
MPARVHTYHSRYSPLNQGSWATCLRVSTYGRYFFTSSLLSYSFLSRAPRSSLEYLYAHIKPATDIFQQLMGALFFDMLVVVVYMEDIIIFGYLDFGTHLLDVTEVLKRLSDVGMQVNPDKCMWFSSSVTYLGFQISREGINPFEPELKIEIVPRWYYITLCIRTRLTVILLRTGTVGSVRLSRLISFNIFCSV